MHFKETADSQTEWHYDHGFR